MDFYNNNNNNNNNKSGITKNAGLVEEGVRGFYQNTGGILFGIYALVVFFLI